MQKKEEEVCRTGERIQGTQRGMQKRAEKGCRGGRRRDVEEGEEGGIQNREEKEGCRAGKRMHEREEKG